MSEFSIQRSSLARERGSSQSEPVIQAGIKLSITGHPELPSVFVPYGEHGETARLALGEAQVVIMAVGHILQKRIGHILGQDTTDEAAD